MGVVSPYSDGTPLVAHCLLGADGTVRSEHDADVPVYAASTLKAAVMVAAHRLADAGRLDWSATVPVTRRFASAVDGSAFGFDDPDDRDPGLPDDGTPATLELLVERMVVVSSNEATNLVLSVVGYDAVAEALAACGCTASRVERLIGDLAARAAGLTHETTARDLATLVHAVVTDRAASPEACAAMRATLSRQEYPEIGAVLPAGTPWGSKSGWVDGILHDVAYVGQSGERASYVGQPGERASYVLAVCTRGYEEEHARSTVHALSRLAWDLSAP